MNNIIYSYKGMLAASKKKNILTKVELEKLYMIQRGMV
jgi:hypothetical protein